MKYKQVFFIWLLADAFLALGLLAFAFYEQFTGGAKDDFGMFLLVAAYGICISLPSLIVMLLFNLVYTNNAKEGSDHRAAYILLIISINILYLVIGQLYGMTGEFNYFYIASTAAGLLSFYLVDKKARKKLAS
jgi:uncharacterized membrane protein YdjX (TVP38/TMEM64 family)